LLLLPLALPLLAQLLFALTLLTLPLLAEVLLALTLLALPLLSKLATLPWRLRRGVINERRNGHSRSCHNRRPDHG
jgi:hypothetical protein